MPAWWQNLLRSAFAAKHIFTFSFWSTASIYLHGSDLTARCTQLYGIPWSPLATVGYLLESCKLLNCAWTSVRKRRFGWMWPSSAACTVKASASIVLLLGYVWVLKTEIPWMSRQNSLGQGLQACRVYWCGSVVHHKPMWFYGTDQCTCEERSETHVLYGTDHVALWGVIRHQECCCLRYGQASYSWNQIWATGVNGPAICNTLIITNAFKVALHIMYASIVVQDCFSASNCW